jgi:hypothetical protein
MAVAPVSSNACLHHCNRSRLAKLRIHDSPDLARTLQRVVTRIFVENIALLNDVWLIDFFDPIIRLDIFYTDRD